MFANATLASAPASAAVSNTGAYNSFLEDVEALGKLEGAGTNSRPELAIKVTEAAQNGLISTEASSSDVADVWDAFRKSISTTATNKLERQASEKQQVSKLKQFARLGQVPSLNFDPVEMITHAREVVNNTPGCKGRTFDHLVKLAREQMKSPGEMLTDEQIRGFIQPADKDIKSELEKLQGALKTLTKIMEGNEEKGEPAYPSKELADAQNSLERRVSILQEQEKASELLQLRIKREAREQIPVVTSQGNEQLDEAA